MLQIKLHFFSVVLIIFDVLAWGALPQENRPKACAEKEQTIKSAVKEEWLTQQLDHFNPNDLRNWQQRYFTNDQYYKRGGPVFLMIGGETDDQVEWMTNGTWFDFAKRFGAHCFLLEHRFYGLSRPTKDTSEENLQYLSVEQALSDLATFIPAMNNQYGFEANNKWIAFGGSYPGMLAAWLHLKYPHLIHGVVSSSSPLLPTLDYSVIAEAFKSYSDQCEEVIKNATLEVNALLEQKQGQILTQKFKLCDPADDLDEKDIANLNRRLVCNSFGFMQTYREDLSFFGDDSGTSNITVEMVCDILTGNHQKSAMERLADLNSLMLSAYNLKCLDYKYKNLIDVAKNTSWDAGKFAFTPDDRRWLHILCTGLATFPTSSFQLGTFGNKFPLEFFIGTCMDVFGPEYNAAYINERVKMKTIEYGGLNINTTNTAFVHGSLDPWHLTGLLKNVTNGPRVIYIEGTAHMADMIPETKDDLPQLKAARKQIAKYIKQWLRQ